MTILVDKNNVVVGHGTFSEESSEVTVLIANSMFFNADDYKKVEVDSMPEDIDQYEEFYCYTAENGFYKNSDWSIDKLPLSKQIPLLKKENADLKSELLDTQEALCAIYESIGG